MRNNTEMDDLYLEAMRKWNDEGDYKGAFDLFSQLAEQGYAAAHNCLGLMYGEGEGVEKDQDKSLFWHKSAARIAKNSSYDYGNVARQYEIMGNRRRAFYWWNKAVACGDKSAGLELAKRLLQNKRSSSRKRAIALLQKAAAAHAPLEVSENDKEEAQEILDGLTKTPA